MNVFVTIGSQEPFERMIKSVEEVVSFFPDARFSIQALGTPIATRGVDVYDFLSPDQFANLLDSADLVISHAGIGSILTALTKRKKIIVFPRLARYRETRNDHQLSTAKAFQQLGLVTYAQNGDELKDRLTEVISDTEPVAPVSEFASPELLDSLREFIR